MAPYLPNPLQASVEPDCLQDRDSDAGKFFSSRMYVQILTLDIRTCRVSAVVHSIMNFGADIDLVS